MRTSRFWTTVLGGLMTAALLVGCSGDTSDNGGGDGDTSALAGRLAAAQQHITDSDGLTISLATESLPDGMTGLLNAKGRGYQGETATDAAFEGNVNVVSGGSTIKAEVIAVNGKVWAMTTGFSVYLSIDPKTLHAPDPASLLGAKGDGLPSILVKTESLKEKGQSRDGKDILTSITGTLPGSVVNQYLPSADAAGSFAVTYRLTDDNVLRDVRIAGPFYPDSPDVTYDVTITANDDASPIEPPSQPAQ